MHRDQIILRGVTFFAYHGVLAEEQRDGRQYTVDLDLSADLLPAGQSDELAQTIDYRALADTVVRIGTEQRFDLLEALAHTISEEILARHPGALLRLRVRKHAPRLAGNPDAVAIQIVRGG